MFNYRRNPRSRRFRRNSTPAWGGPLYRRNLLPLARRQELQALSPGNFRRPTLAITKNYLDDWRTHGVSSLDELRAGGSDVWDVSGNWVDRASEYGTTPAIERAKELNRYDEAVSYWDPYQKDQELYEAEPESYYKPKFTQPVGGLEAAIADDRDYGDYEPISRGQAYNYLYQFLHRNAEKRADGETVDDVRVAPFKWRYREAVLEVGPKVASGLAKKVFGSYGKRVPKWYLPENLYDDLGDLFPEVEAAGEAEATAEAALRRRSRKMRRYNPW